MTKSLKKTNKSDLQSRKLKVGVVVPHIFMHEKILPHVIFSPGNLAIELANGLTNLGLEVTLYTPGPIQSLAHNITADMSYFDSELAGRDDSYIDLLKKHPFTFVTLARQLQSELIAKAYAAANNDTLDIVHIYTNEEDTALPFAQFCKKPVIFTHHDPYNFLVKYKSIFPKYVHLNWVSFSYAQRSGMPSDTNWVANIYHGLDLNIFKPVENPTNDYIAYLGRIIEPKGVHLAIEAVREYNMTAKTPLKLKIAGKHYSDATKDTYWQKVITPQLDTMIEYVGFIKDDVTKNEFLGNAKALIMPSIFDEPFGMVMIESLACGTPIIGLDSGAIPEVINHMNGLIITKNIENNETIRLLSMAIDNISSIKRQDCRADFDARFSATRMCQEYLLLYEKCSRG